MLITENSIIDSDAALQYLLSKARVTNKTTVIDLEQSFAKVLAQDIKSTIDVPSFDNSAMDGYAINFDNNKNSHVFEVVDRITAGTTGNPLELNTAARIFTGAPIPLGCNAVIPQEDVTLRNKNDKKFIQVNKKIYINKHIRLRADDIAKGDIILNKGKLLNSADIALIASIGINKIKVFKPLIIGVFFSGNEIVEPNVELKPGQIYNSNKYSLISMLQSLGTNVIDLGIIKDNLDKTLDAITTLAKQCDIIVTTGGVSVGEEDYLRTAVNKLGSVTLWNIKMKPGKPLTYGTIKLANKETHFIGLPGNPVSTIATFVLFIRPFIKKMSGLTIYHNTKFKVAIDYDWQKQFRREFVRVKLNYNNIPPVATKYHKQSSNVLTSTSWADGLAEMTDEKSFVAGDIVNFYPLWS